MAQLEIGGGFSLLVAHSSVALWAALEATIPEIVARLIVLQPKIVSEPAIKKLRLPAELMLGRNRAAVASAIVEELNRNTDAPLKQGIGRFETLLGAVGYGGPVSAEIKRTLFELSHVRHLVVHRFGVVDRQFADACPWLLVKVSRRIKLSVDDYERYSNAARQYALVILKRLLAKADPRLPKESMLQTRVLAPSLLRATRLRLRVCSAHFVARHPKPKA